MPLCCALSSSSYEWVISLKLQCTGISFPDLFNQAHSLFINSGHWEQYENLSLTLFSFVSLSTPPSHSRSSHMHTSALTHKRRGLNVTSSEQLALLPNSHADIVQIAKKKPVRIRILNHTVLPMRLTFCFWYRETISITCDV